MPRPFSPSPRGVFDEIFNIGQQLVSDYSAVIATTTNDEAKRPVRSDDCNNSTDRTVKKLRRFCIHAAAVGALHKERSLARWRTD